MRKDFVLGLCAAAFMPQSVDAIKCNALVLSGGSNNGAWEVGVMWGLTHYGNPEDYYWDVISGISAGALNTVGTAGFKPEEVIEMNQYMSDSWLNQTTAEVWTRRPGGFFHLLLDEPSFLDDTLGLNHLREIMSVRTKYNRRVTVGAVDANNGEFVEFNQDNTSYYDFAQAAMSSGSIPGVMPPQHFKGHVLMDGGTVYDVNITSAMNQCHDMGATNEEITVDVLVCGTLPLPDETVGTTVHNWRAARDIKSYWGSTNSITEELISEPGVTLRWYFQEHNTSCEINSLNFDGDATWCLQELGRDDAQAALQLGQDTINERVREWTASKDLQVEFPYIRDYIYA